MDIEVLKLIAQITVIPCMGLISALVVSVFGGWVSFQFSKSLENYKRSIVSKSPTAANESEPNATVVINDNTVNKVGDETFLNWIAKALARGTVVILNLFFLAAGTIITFIIFRPFGITFINNRINELIQFPAFRELYYEVTQFFSIELLSNLYLFGMSIIVGLFVMAFSSMILDVVSWVFNINLNE